MHIIPDLSPLRHASGDDEIAAQAKARLQKSTYREIRTVICEARDNVLRLSGNVPKYFYKQVAQSLLIDRLPGRPRIENQLIVDGE